MSTLKYNHNNLLPWFLEDHGQLPEAYVKSCEKFFKEISDKRQAASRKRQATSGLTRVEGYYRMEKTNKGERT